MMFNHKIMALAAGLLLGSSSAWALPIQDFPAQAEMESVGEGWVPLDGVATIVNDEIVTLAELSRKASRLRERVDRPISTLDQMREFESEVRELLVFQRLQAQAGRLIGPADEDVDRLITSHLARTRRRIGLESYLEDLELSGMSADEKRIETRRDFYDQTWRDAIVGGTNSSKRPHRDRFVRPGEMLHTYVRYQDQFGAPEQVDFEIFQMAANLDLDPVAAMAEAEALRQRAADGADLLTLVSEIGPERCGSRSITIPVRNLTDSAAKQLAQEGQPGQVSELQSERNPQTDRLEYSFLLLVGRRAALPPRPFLDDEVQAMLSGRALAVRDQWFLSLGRQVLLDGSFIRPPLEPTP